MCELLIEKDNPAALIRTSMFKKTYFDNEDEDPIYNINQADLPKIISGGLTINPLVIGSNQMLLKYFELLKLEVPNSWIRTILLPSKIGNSEIKIGLYDLKEIEEELSKGRAFLFYPAEFEEPAPHTLTRTTFPLYAEKFGEKILCSTHIRRSYVCDVWVRGDIIEHVHLERFAKSELPDIMELPKLIRIIEKTNLKSLESVFLRFFSTPDTGSKLFPEQAMSSLFAPPLPSPSDFYNRYVDIFEDVMSEAELLRELNATSTEQAR